MTDQEYEKLLVDAIDEYAYAASLDTYELLYVNDTLCKHMNITPDDWQGKKCYEVMRCAKRPCVFCTKDYIRLNETYSRYRYRYSQDMHFITKDKIVDCDSGRVLIQTSYDVANDFVKIRNLQSGMHLNKAIISCAKTLLNDGSVQVNISKLLRIVCEYYRGTSANVFEYNPQTCTVDCNYQYQSIKTNVDRVVTNAKKENNGDINPLQSWWDILQESDIIYIPSISQRYDVNSREYDAFAKNGVESCLLTTLKIEGKMAGVVIVDNPKTIPDNYDLFSTASIFISNNLEKNRTVCHLRSTVDSVEGKIGINNILLECADLLFEGASVDGNVTINKILAKICEYFDADRLSLCEVAEEGNAMRNTYECTNGKAPSLIDELEGAVMPIPEFLFNDMLSNPTLFARLDDPKFDKNSVDYKILSSFDVPSLIMTALLKKGEFAGLLAVHHPRKNIENRDLLRTISGFILSEIAKRDIVKELEALSFTDKLTGVFNRNFYLHTIEKFEKELPPKLGVIFADINGLKRANDNLGHEFGDGLIKWCGDFLAKYNPDCVYRIGGDEFVCFVEGMESEEFFDHIQVMRLELHNANLPNMSMGGTWSNGEQTIDQQIIETDKIMYLEKQKYYILKQITQIDPEYELEVLRNLLDPII